VLVMTAIGARARPAAAAEATAEREARRQFEAAEVDYKAGHYADALVKYQAGYAAKPLPGFLVNIAQCQRRLGDLKAARASYREFILVAPDSRLVPEVQKLIQQLDAVIADLAAGGDGAAAAEVGSSGDVHASELGAPLALAPPQPPPPSPPLIAAPAAQPAPRPVAHEHARWWLWGGVAAAAIAGGVVAGLALASPESTTIHAGSLGTLSR
jgi:tetratricopeptide (TPR) repeat protein